MSEFGRPWGTQYPHPDLTQYTSNLSDFSTLSLSTFSFSTFFVSCIYTIAFY